MTRHEKLTAAQLNAFLESHSTWENAGNALVKAYRFPDFSGALAFVVRVGLLAEKHDHHPDVELGYGKAKLTWTTHDAGGITTLDVKLAEATDALVTGQDAAHA